MKKLVAFILVILLMAVVFGCGSQPAQTSPTPVATPTPTGTDTAPIDVEPVTYTVGCSFPYSAMQTTAELMEMGIEGYLQFFAENMSWSEGKNFKIVPEYADNQANAEVTMASGERLAAYVDAFIGCYSSVATVALVPIAEKYEKPFIISLSVSDSCVASPTVYCFRPTAGNSDGYTCHRNMWLTLAETQGVPFTKVAVVNGSGEFFITSADIHLNIMKEEFPDMEVVYRETVQDFATTDMTGIVRKIMQQDPQVVITMLQAPEAALFQNTMRELECKTPVYTGGAGYMDPAFTDSIPKGGADGVVSQCSFAPDILNYTEPAGLGWKWYDIMKEQSGKDPNEATAATWLCMGILMDALDRAASPAGPDVAAALKETNLETTHPANMFTYYGGGVQFDKVPGYSDGIEWRYNQNVNAGAIYVQCREDKWVVCIAYDETNLPEGNLQWPIPCYKVA